MYERSLATLEGATPAFWSFDAIFSRRDFGKSILGSFIDAPSAEEKSLNFGQMRVGPIQIG